MALPNKPEFCKKNCKHLNITEVEQKHRRYFASRLSEHFCSLYGKVVKHHGYEPYLVKLTECKE